MHDVPRIRRSKAISSRVHHGKRKGSKDILCIYVFHEMNNAVKFFIENGIYRSKHVDFHIVINNPDTKLVDIPSYVNVTNRENVGHDFGGWSSVLHKNKD